MSLQSYKVFTFWQHRRFIYTKQFISNSHTAPIYVNPKQCDRQNLASLLWQTSHGPRGHSCSTVDPDLGQHGLCVAYLDCFPEVSIINISTVFQNFDVSASQQIGPHIDIYVSAESDLASVFMNISHVSSTIGAQPVVRSNTEVGWNLSSLVNSAYHGNYRPLYDSLINSFRRLPSLIEILSSSTK